MQHNHPALFSIHDVMPSTISDVGTLIEVCHQHGVEKLTLLIVPGCDWRSADLQQLRVWLSMGCELAGHGWIHRCRSVRGWRHRIHSVLLSRDVAEHLSLSDSGVVSLMNNCAQWFKSNGLGCPELYVPPAWALGRVRRSKLSDLPFSMIETLSGVRLVRESSRQRLPLLGFEADTWLREWSLRGFNRVNRFAAPWRTVPIRVAIHPSDHRLRLRQDFKYTLDRGWRAISYRAIFGLKSTIAAGQSEAETAAVSSGR